MAVASTVFHVAVVGYFMVVTNWMKQNMLQYRLDQEEVNDPMVSTMKRYSLRFLTNWTFTLETIFFFIALGEEVLALFKGQEKLKDKVHKYKNYFFTVLVAPMAMLVSIIFWGIWSIDRNLIFPTVMDQYLPPWINHSLHTMTSIIVLLEMYLCFHKYPSFKQALLGITLYLLSYSVCLMLTYYESGAWLYPVFQTLSWPLRISFCLATYVLAIALYGAQYFMNTLLWDDKVATKKAPKKKHKKH